MKPFEWSHAVRDVPAGGLPVERTATREEAQRLAEALEILSVDHLIVRYRLTPKPGGCLALTGTIEARLSQECVVTLEPVVSPLSLPVNVIFTPTPHPGEDAAERSLDDLEGPEEEPIENGTVDVGRIVFEELLSGLDPYPRSPEASFEWTDEGAGEADNPFAALRRLRKPTDQQ